MTVLTSKNMKNTENNRLFSSETPLSAIDNPRVTPKPSISVFFIKSRKRAVLCRKGVKNSRQSGQKVTSNPRCDHFFTKMDPFYDHFLTPPLINPKNRKMEVLLFPNPYSHKPNGVKMCQNVSKWPKSRKFTKMGQKVAKVVKK